MAAAASLPLDIAASSSSSPRHGAPRRRGGGGGEPERDAGKAEQDKLSGLVKGVHRRLRKKLKEVGDFGRVWREHCADGEALSEYASAMRSLAREHWSQRREGENRIDWCRSVCLEYFLSGGMERALAKDERRRQVTSCGGGEGTATRVAYSPRHISSARTVETEAKPPWWGGDGGSCRTSNGGGMGGSVSERWRPSDRGASGAFSPYGSPLEASLQPPRRQSGGGAAHTGKIRLLDVGSCFNPFLCFDEFQALGIDIIPAVDSVFRCDFLNLQLDAPLQLAPESQDAFLRQLPGPVVRSLPRELFHAVVFSLLLSYFPSPCQRWLCCQTAHGLLAPDGLLLIVTPDSSHAGRHAGMVRSWRLAIEALGFKRWRYVKASHMHLMAFRKVTNQHSSDLLSHNYPEMLYIPQDFTWEDTERGENGGGEMDLGEHPSARSLFEDRLLADGFSELPDLAAFPASLNDSDSEESQASSLQFHEMDDPILLLA
ncbi:S-adenosylmethionine sensor upstream of mTORC1 isoform X1 [Lampetra planeri]